MSKEKKEWPAVAVERLWEKGNRHETVKSRFNLGRWRVSDLRDIVKDQPAFDLPLCCIDLGGHEFSQEGGLLGFARHMRHVNEADLSFPIILDEWGMPLDGRHRIVKALMEGRTTIKAVRVPQNTSPTISE